MRISKLFVAGLVISMCASSAFADAGSYTVSATLSHAGKSFASPSLIVRAGEPATIEVSGADPYKFVVTIQDKAPDEIQVSASVKSSYGSMAPILLVRPGQAASIAVDSLSIELVVSRGGE